MASSALAAASGVKKSTCAKPLERKGGALSVAMLTRAIWP
jgi:hypothetical protein